MHKESLVADIEFLCVRGDRVACYHRPRVDKPLLQQGCLQSLCPQVPEYQILQLLCLSFEHPFPNKFIVYSFKISPSLTKKILYSCDELLSIWSR